LPVARRGHRLESNYPDAWPKHLSGAAILLPLVVRGGGRWSLIAASIAAYAGADKLSPQPYTQIDVATLRLLSGDREASVVDAVALLATLNEDNPFQETPYYLAATRAEALLLCCDAAAAEAALATAIRHNPHGWSDHASTLRQFRLILSSQDLDDTWLDAYRPPQSLHYAGHLCVAEPGETALKAAVDMILAANRIGFGFGALDAGADIVIAEALLAHGAELHLVLPVARDAFEVQSVAPYGARWAARFHACYAAALSVQTATSRPSTDNAPWQRSLRQGRGHSRRSSP
jgi:hypothetical protein